MSRRLTEYLSLDRDLGELSCGPVNVADGTRSVKGGAIIFGEVNALLVAFDEVGLSIR